MRTVHSADIMQPCEDFHHNRKSPSGFTLAAKGPKGPNGESKHNRRPPLTLQQVLVLREARRSKGQRRKRSRDLGVSLGGVGLFPLKSPSATFVVCLLIPSRSSTHAAGPRQPAPLFTVARLQNISASSFPLSATSSRTQKSLKL